MIYLCISNLLTISTPVNRKENINKDYGHKNISTWLKFASQLLDIFSKLYHRVFKILFLKLNNSKNSQSQFDILWNVLDLKISTISFKFVMNLKYINNLSIILIINYQYLWKSLVSYYSLNEKKYIFWLSIFNYSSRY